MVRSSLLSVRDVSTRFGGIVALDSVSFEMAEGQIVGLIGPNGAGKTTLFNCLSRLYTPNEGDILFEGRSLLPRGPHHIAALGIGRTFQNLALFSTMTVLQNVMVGVHGRTRSDFLSWSQSRGGRRPRRAAPCDQGPMGHHDSARAGGTDASKGLLTALYMEVTDPQWQNDQGYKDWVAWMKKYYPEGALDDQANAYAYSVAQLLPHVLKQCGNDLSRANIMKQAASVKDLALPILLPGININTGPNDFAPIEQEQLAKFDGERWALFGELHEASKK